MNEIAVYHRNGVTWGEAPAPRRWHRCKPWTTGIDDGRLIERCACGATRINGRSWHERGQRR